MLHERHLASCEFGSFNFGWKPHSPYLLPSALWVHDLMMSPPNHHQRQVKWVLKEEKGEFRRVADETIDAMISHCKFAPTTCH